MNSVQASVVNSAKYGQGTYSAGGDAIDWSYYDTNLVPATASPVRYFTNPVGAAGKTLADTNMISAGQIPKAQNHTVTHIKTFFASHAAHATADVQAFYTMLKQTTVEFIIANKYYYGQWTLQELMGAASLFALTPTVAGDTIRVIQPRFHGILPLNNAIILAENTNFELRVTYNAIPTGGIVGDFLMISLYGKLAYAT
jgi:hypothetical protein